MPRYDALPIIPLEHVRLDLFKHLSLPKFLRKLNESAIALHVICIEPSQKSQKGVHVEDLADFSDSREQAAQTEFKWFHYYDMSERQD